MDDIRTTAVVTGGSSGIGLAVAEQLLQAGFRVAFFGGTEANVRQAENRLVGIADPAMVIGRRVDLRSSDAIQSFFREVEDIFGGVGVLINSAGISPKDDGKRIPLHLIPLNQWQDVAAVNLTGAFLCTQCVLPRMMEANFGRIVMVGSIAARTLPRFAGAAYVASKSGLAGLTRSIAAEYAGHNITANTVSPGNVASGMTGNAQSPQNQEAITRIPAGRIGEPADFAGIVAFLCSEGAAFITGATIDVTGAEYVSC